MKLELEQSDIDAIADAIVAKMGNAAPASEESKPASKPAAKDKPANKPAAKGKPAAKDKPAVERGDVLNAVKALGEAKGRDVAKACVAKYAESFGDVSDEDLPKLLADVEAASAEGEDAPSGDDDY